MNILGIDPGYDRVGIAVISLKEVSPVLVDSSCILTDASLPFPERLSHIGKEVQKILNTHKPSEVAIEKTFFSKNKKTAIAVSEARGVIQYEVSLKKLPVFEYSPPEIKVATTGHGGTNKKQVEEMVCRLLNINKDIAYDDEYDAIAVALTHAASRKYKAL